MNADYEDLKEIDKEIADLILNYREGKIDITPGGGGRYGSLNLKNKGLDEWIT